MGLSLAFFLSKPHVYIFGDPKMERLDRELRTRRLTDKNESLFEATDWFGKYGNVVFSFRHS